MEPTQFTPWWLWLLASMAMLLAEVFLPGTFFFLFFAIGALVTGLASIFMPLSPVWAITLFTVVSLASLAAFRKRLRSRVNHEPGSANIDSLVGQIAAALQPIPARGRGKVELRGAPWNALNVGADVVVGQRCRVLKVDGISLEITAE